MGNTFKKSKLFITVGSTDTFTNVGSIGLIQLICSLQTQLSITQQSGLLSHSDRVENPKLCNPAKSAALFCWCAFSTLINTWFKLLTEHLRTSSLSISSQISHSCCTPPHQPFNCVAQAQPLNLQHSLHIRLYTMYFCICTKGNSRILLF